MQSWRSLYTTILQQAPHTEHLESSILTRCPVRPPDTQSRTSPVCPVSEWHKDARPSSAPKHLLHLITFIHSNAKQTSIAPC